MARASQEEDNGSDDSGDDGNGVNVLNEEDWSKIKHTSTTINLLHIINTITFRNRMVNDDARSDGL